MTDSTLQDPRFEHFFATAVDLLCIADTAGFIRMVNPAWQRVLGWTPAELMARPYLELVHPDDVISTKEAAEALERGETVLRFTNRYRHKAGGYRRLEWCSMVRPDEGLIYATVRDITDASRQVVHQAQIEAIGGVGSWEIDVDTGTVFWSTMTHKIHETEATTARPDLEEALRFFPPAAQAELRPAIARLLTIGAPYDLELPFVTAKGRPLWVRITAAAELRGGKVARAFGTLQDITERRIAAETLRRNEERHRLAQVVTGVGIFDWSPLLGCMTGDGYCWAMLGYPAAARTLDYAAWHADIHPDDKARLDAATATLAVGGSFDVEFRYRSAANEWLWVRGHGDAVERARDGAPLRVVGTIMDISASKRLELELVAARNRLQTTLDAIPDLLLEIDADDRFVGYHSGSLELLAAPPEAFLGRTMAELFPPAVTAVGRAALREAAETGSSIGHQYCLELAGGPRWFELSVRLRPPDGAGERPGFILLTRDVTARRQAEEALQGARERAEQASLAKSRFLANMSHEIRTPMNGVLGMAEVLDHALSDPAHKRMLAVIRESGAVVLNLLNDILDMSKIEADKLDLEAVVFLPIELARKVESLHSLKAAEKRLGFAVLTGPGADRPRLGDPNRIMQILHNLLSNALKFTERGSVTVTLGCEPDGPLRIEVRDTGIGMTEPQVARIFEDFEQADSSVTRRFGGTGLGMSIVRRLVQLMGGEIEVESRPGEGTRVRALLPLAAVAASPPQVPSDAPREPPLKGLRVLAADDNEINRLVLGAMLDQLVMTTTMVSSGHEAVERAGDQRFDVILLDISMPDMDGIEALAAIRAREAALGRPPTPAIAVTANALNQQIRDYMAAGFDAHIPKPLRPEALAAVLAAAVGDRASEGTVAPCPP
jgi:PAS domain S-box-containing protein